MSSLNAASIPMPHHVPEYLCSAKAVLCNSSHSCTVLFSCRASAPHSMESTTIGALPQGSMCSFYRGMVTRFFQRKPCFCSLYTLLHVQLKLGQCRLSLSPFFQIPSHFSWSTNTVQKTPWTPSLLPSIRNDIKLFLLHMITHVLFHRLALASSYATHYIPVIRITWQPTMHHRRHKFCWPSPHFLIVFSHIIVQNILRISLHRKKSLFYRLAHYGIPTSHVHSSLSPPGWRVLSKNLLELLW